MATTTIGPTNGTVLKYDVAYIGPNTLTLNASNFAWFTTAKVAAIYTKSANRQGYAANKLSGLPSLTQFVAATSGLPNVYELNLKAQIDLDTSQFCVIGQSTSPATKLSVPTNFRQTASTATTATLAWDLPTGATGSGLLLGGSTQIAVSGNSYTGAAGSYQVRALYGPDATLNSDYSAAVQATVAGQPYTITPQTADHSYNAGIADAQGDGTVRRASLASLFYDVVGERTAAVRVKSNGSNRAVSVYLGGQRLVRWVSGGGGVATYQLSIPNDGRLEYRLGRGDRDYEQGDILAPSILDMTFPGNGSATLYKAAPTEEILGFVDSIGSGAAADEEGYAALLRRSTRGYTASGYGSHTGAVALGTASGRAIALQQCDALWTARANIVKTIDISLGTNDYEFGTQTPTEVASGMAIFLDTVHAKYPDARAWIYTPFNRYDKTYPIRGYTLQDGRDAESLVAVGREDYVKVIDGASILVQSDLSTSDSLHPTFAGHIKVAAKKKADFDNRVFAAQPSGPVALPAATTFTPPFGLSADIPWSRIVAGDNGTKDYVTGTNVLTVPNGYGTPSIVPNAFGSRSAFNFVASENDRYVLNTSNASEVNYLVALAIYPRSYDSNGTRGIVLSGLTSNPNGAVDIFYSLKDGANQHIQSRVIENSFVPVGAPTVVVFFATSDNKGAVRYNGQTYYTQNNSAFANGTYLPSLTIGGYQGGAGWAIDGLYGIIGLAPGFYTEEQAIGVEQALRTACGL
jgi:hypothetical protein